MTAPRAVRSHRSALAGAVLLGLSLLLLPVAAGGPAPLVRPSGVTFPSPGTGIVATVFWNGAPAAPAHSASSAISTSFANTARVEFTWAWGGSGLGATFAIGEARLNLIFLGQPAWTTGEVFQPARAAAFGSYNQSVDLTGDRYLLEGLYEVQVILFSDSHTEVWSETFFLHAEAPYHLTAVNLGLVGLAAYSVAELFRGRRPRAMRSDAVAPPTPPREPSMEE